MKSIAKTEDVSGLARPVERDWTKGSITSSLWQLSWPMVVSSSLMMMGPTIDMIWVGKLGAAAIGGVGAAGIGVMMADTMRMGLLTGLRAMVARHVGAGNKTAANHAANQAFVLSIIFSFVVAVVGVFLAEKLLTMLGLSPDVVATGAVYMKIQFIGSIGMSFRMVTDGIMQASGDSVTPMKIAIVFRVLHVTLCPFLIFGWWVFPQMGVAGAATTAVISQTVGMILGMWLLFTGHSRLRPSLKGFRIDFRTIWKMVKIGIPSSIMGVQNNLGQFLMMGFMAPFGTVAVAAHTLGQRVENAVMMPPWGIGMAAGVLAGQNLGAHQPERAQKSGWRAVLMVQGFMFLCALAILLLAEKIVAVFDAEPEMVLLGSHFLRIAAAGYLVMGFTMVFQQCITGAGDTFKPMLISIILMWGIQMPLAFYFTHNTGIGIYGIRWAIVIGMVAAAVVYTIYFQSGTWKRKRL